MSRIQSTLNVLGSYAAWWGCILGVQWNHPYLGTLPTWGYLGLHLWSSTRRRNELLFLLLATLAGTFVDSLFAASGLLLYKGGYTAWLAPLWISALWAGFAATLNHSLRWLHRNGALAILLAGVAAPLSYYGGVRLKAIQFGNPTWLPPVLLSLSWMCLIPFLLWLAKQLELVEP